MLENEGIEKIQSLAEEVSQREGCRLYDLECLGQGRNRTLRIFIDALEGSVTLEQCANVSRGLSLLLDVEDLVPGGNYDLEISSPGLERSLKREWQFLEAVGKKIQIHTTESPEYLTAQAEETDQVAMEEEKDPKTSQSELAEERALKKRMAKRGFHGVLESVEEQSLVMEEAGGDRIRIPLHIVSKGKLVYDFGAGTKSDGKSPLGGKKKDKPKKSKNKKSRKGKR